MRNLPLVAYRLTAQQRDACQSLADLSNVKLNELAKRALLDLVTRVNADGMRVNAGTPPATGSRELTIERDPVG